MFNSTFLIVIFLFILSAVLFTSISVSIALYYAKRKADTEEKTLIEENDYIKIILIFSLINFITYVYSSCFFIKFYCRTYFCIFSINFCSGLDRIRYFKIGNIQKVFLFKDRKDKTSRNLCRNLRTVLYFSCQLTAVVIYDCCYN